MYLLYAFVRQQHVFFHTQNLNRKVQGLSLAVMGTQLKLRENIEYILRDKRELLYSMCTLT
jgi:hypothetical protein